METTLLGVTELLTFEFKKCLYFAEREIFINSNKASKEINFAVT